MTGDADRVRRALGRVDPSLNAFITLDDRAVARAVTDPPGRLRGLTFAIKDNIDTAGQRTTYGSLRHREHVPTASAQIVDALLAEGALILGKTNLNEYAYGVSGHNPHFGTMRSPADRARTAGGSSGGSAAAVAAGVCDIGVGTDTSGSVRIPAACCGVYGFKASHAAYPMGGVFPLAASYDSIGFLSADVASLARVLGVAVADDVPPGGVVTLGDGVEIPPLPEEHWVLFRREVYPVHREQMETAPESFTDDVRLKLSAHIGDVESATRVMAAWRRAADEALAGVDIAISDVFAGPPPTVEAILREYDEGSRVESLRLLAFTPVANALGWPAMTAPTESGPKHLLCRPGSEAAMLALAAKIGLSRAEVLERAGAHDPA